MTKFELSTLGIRLNTDQKDNRMKKKVAEQAEMWGWEWGDRDTKLRKQPNSNYFPICPLHSSVGTMHLWSIVTKAQQDSN